MGAPLDLSSFRNAQLRGGTSIESITISEEPIVDVSGGPALGHTSTNLGTGAMEIELRGLISGGAVDHNLITR